MDHRKNGKKLGRTSAHRQALLKNMCIALAEHGQITTTLAKAKFLRPFFERLITKARDNSLHVRRYLFSILRSDDAVNNIFTLAEKYKERPGGYTRIVKCGYRYGDSAPKAIMQLVDLEA